MSNFVIGPGVQQAIIENEDEARSDEQFIILTEGEKISQTFGAQGIYYWLEHDNVVRMSPF